MSAGFAAQQVLGNYVIERELGRGGMGAIYLGVHQSLGKRAAIKVLLPELSRREDLIARFWAEARAVTAIKHASIVDVYDYGVTPEGSTYIVMEYLEGETLGARLKARGLLPIPQAVAIARQIATALAAAHAVGVVHRDLKPDNVFLVPDPEVVSGERAKLLDFGVAKLVVADTDSTAKTVTGALLGTPHYMSPEQCEGARAVDHRSDLYSLGCTLFQMVSGRLPFESQGVGGLIGMHLHVPPPKLRDRAPHASRVLEQIVARLLEKQPEARFSSGTELAGALSAPEAVEVDASASAPLPRQVVDANLPTAVSRIADGQDPSHAPTLLASSERPTVPRPKQRSRYAWIGASISLVGVVALIAFMSRNDTTGSRNYETGNSTSTAGNGVGNGVDAGLTRELEQPDAQVLAQGPLDDDIDAAGILADVATLFEQKKWVEAGLRAQDLFKTGMPRDRIAEILATQQVAATGDVQRQVTDLVEAGECADASRLAKRFELGWGKLAQRAKQLASKCTSDEGDGDMMELLAEALTEGRPAEAVMHCQKQKTLTHDMRMVCALAACTVKNERLQKTWSVRLTSDELKQIAQLCKAGVGAVAH